MRILSPDTDVFILAVWRQLELGDNMCMIVGCDTTEKFTGKGKETSWNTLKVARPNVIRAFGQLGKTNKLSQDTFDALENFVCSLRSAIVNISALRWHLYKKKEAETEKLFPTHATL